MQTEKNSLFWNEISNQLSKSVNFRNLHEIEILVKNRNFGQKSEILVKSFDKDSKF